MQVRNPLSQIAERATAHLPPLVEFHVEDPMPRGPGADTMLRRALMHYVTWHEHLLPLADKVYRVEDADMVGVCREAGFGQRCSSKGEDADGSRGAALWRELTAYVTSKKWVPETSWTELQRLDAEYAERARTIAAALGYCTAERRGVNATMFRDAWDGAMASRDSKSGGGGGGGGKGASGGDSAPKVKATKAFEPPKAPPIDGLAVKRSINNPVVHQEHFTANAFEVNPGGVVSGPALLEVPSWVKGAKAKYYLYSSHSSGKYIRLSTADSPQGPYKVRKERTEGGASDGADMPVLSLKQVEFCGGHMANPFVVVNEDTRKILLYFHCGVCVASDTFSCGIGGEVVFAGASDDGLHFDVFKSVLWKQTLKVTRVGAWWYFFGRNEVFASRDGVTDLQPVGHTWMPFPSPFTHNNKLYLTWPDDGACAGVRGVLGRVGQQRGVCGWV